jgi:hypothetical protein
MTTTISYTGRLVVATCWCGIKHAVPEELHDRQARQHRDGVKQASIYCPLGHSYINAGEGEAERLRRELGWQRDRVARANARADQAEASARAHKGAATKARKRAAAAVCPCCNRSFVQLRRHMATKHPDYDPAAAA